MKKLIVVFTAILLSLLVWACSDDNPVSKEQKESGTIYGRVITGSSTKLSDVTVSISNTDLSTTTDTLGNFVFPNVSLGEHTLSFTRESYLDTTINGVLLENDLDSVEVVTAMTFDITADYMALPITGSLTGILTDIAKIEVLTTGSFLPNGAVIVNELQWDSATQTFSGDVYRSNSGIAWRAEIKVYDSKGSVTGYTSVEFNYDDTVVTVPAFDSWNAKPIVSITAPLICERGKNALFSATALDTVYGDSIMSYQWNFGDGTFASGEEVTHVFMSEKNYAVTLIVTDDDGNSVSGTKDIVVTNPHAIITGLNDTTITINDTVTFSLDISDMDGVKAVYWDFGEGDSLRPQYDTTYTGGVISLFHQYPGKDVVPSDKEKIYTVKITVLDSLGELSSETAKITVSNEAPFFVDVAYPKFVMPGEQIDVNFSDGDDGEVVQREYYLGNEYIECGNSFSVTAPDTFKLQYQITIRITDNDENVSYKRLKVDVGLWKATAGDENENESASSVIACDDGGFVVAGSLNNAVWLCKLDEAGKEIWSKTFGEDKVAAAKQVIAARDGGYLVVGATENSSNSGYMSIFVGKTDNGGNEQWRSIIGTGGLYAFAYSVVEADNGDFIIVGETETVDDAGRDIAVIRIDGSGSVLWNKTFGSAGDDCGGAIVATQDGNYVIAGTYSYSADYYNNPCLIKIDNNGNEIWRKIYEGDHTKNYKNWVNAIVSTDNSGFILVGRYSCYEDDKINGWSIKTDDEGNKISSAEIGYNATDIKTTKDGGYVIAGYHKTGVFSFSYYESWIRKYDSNDSYEWGPVHKGTQRDYYANSVVTTSDGGYVVAGAYQKYFTGDVEDTDILVYKANSTGETVELD